MHVARLGLIFENWSTGKKSRGNLLTDFDRGTYYITTICAGLNFYVTLPTIVTVSSAMTSTMIMKAALAPSCPSRSTDFWFDDGNVVLQVESTLFRVHRSILSMRSEVFQGMFSVPQPPAVDGDLANLSPTKGYDVYFAWTKSEYGNSLLSWINDYKF